jgi:uncharacterized membrane protein YkvI
MTSNTNHRASTWFQRFLLPGFAFKATVIGGGYATGRELAEFFLPSGPWGGIAGMVLAMFLWSLVCMVTFVIARRNETYDYQSFFRCLLGRGWIVYELAYALFIIVVLSVFAAAAGAIGTAMFGLPRVVGTCALMVAIAVFVAFGTSSIERLFKYVSFLLYAIYAIFALLALTKFGNEIAQHFSMKVASTGWFLAGMTYTGYNIIGAVVILPVLRHLTSSRDAMIAGALAGPLAMLPALIFFICMMAFYPSIGGETLPSDFMLRRLDIPMFHYLFQIMIFSALLESGAGFVHAINERIDAAWTARGGLSLGRITRLYIAAGLLVICIFVADHFGLARLISYGYRYLSYVFLAVYVAPLLTVGLIRASRGVDT